MQNLESFGCGEVCEQNLWKYMIMVWHQIPHITSENHNSQSTNDKCTNFIWKWRSMCLALPQKISNSMDLTWEFHKRNGSMCHFGIHVKKIIIIKNPANGKMIKIHNQILDMFMSLMQKIPQFLELKWAKNELLNFDE
jgi:hypothetical protein